MKSKIVFSLSPSLAQKVTMEKKIVWTHIFPGVILDFMQIQVYNKSA